MQAGTAGPPKSAAVPVSLATNIRLGTNHSPNADDSIGTPLAGADNLSGAVSVVAAYAAASGASAPTAAERALAAASAASAVRAAAFDAARVNAGNGNVAVAASAAAKRVPSQWTPTPKPRKAQAMIAVVESPTIWRRLRPVLLGFDLTLMIAVLMICAIGLVTMYSAGFDYGTRFSDHARNMALAFGVLFVAAQISPQNLMRVAVPLYTLGLALLVATAVFGITKKGAQRWLNVGMVIQPSEIMKLAMPLMLAWWFQKREGQLRALDFAIAGLILLLPVALVVKQPDLGTAILILSAGLYVIFFAGLSWKLILPVLVLAAVGIIAVVMSEDRICQDEVIWPLLRDYQKHRICTLLDPTTDPLGKGFHIIQGMIAIGSGGITGKGFMSGTQTHLEFIPERTTDFIFAAFSEEFGMLGALLLLFGFTMLILRGLAIAADAPSVFTRLLAGSITLSFFTYAFVNMGMVSGILPVVGVPLPFVSYGGTAMVTLGLGLGFLTSIARNRRSMQT